MMVLLISVSLVATQQEPATIPLEQVVERVVDVSPAMAAARGAVAAPRGQRSESLLPFPSNPTFEYGRVRRQSIASTVYDREWRVNQEIEIAGQWLQRRRAASNLVSSAEERVVDTRRRVMLEARIAYLNLHVAERRAALTDSAAAFTERLAGFAERQLEAGEISRLESNAAALEAARARSVAERSLAQRAAMAAELARLMNLPSDRVLATAALPAIPELQIDAEIVLTFAVTRRADLSAARLASNAADRTLAAAKLSFVPNLSLSVFGGREDATDDLFGLGIGFSIPLFQRGQGARGFAAAGRSLARAELAETERAIRAEVRSTVERFERTARAENRFLTGVLNVATENVALTETALVEGEVSLTEVMVLRTAAVAAQLEYLEVFSDAAQAWFELAAAVNADPAELAGLINN